MNHRPYCLTGYMKIRLRPNSSRYRRSCWCCGYPCVGGCAPGGLVWTWCRDLWRNWCGQRCQCWSTPPGYHELDISLLDDGGGNDTVYQEQQLESGTVREREDNTAYRLRDADIATLRAKTIKRLCDKVATELERISDFRISRDVIRAAITYHQFFRGVDGFARHSVCILKEVIGKDGVVVEDERTRRLWYAIYITDEIYGRFNNLHLGRKSESKRKRGLVLFDVYRSSDNIYVCELG